MIKKFSKLVLNVTCASFILLIDLVDAWNSLPNWIVMTNSTNTFKCRLDIYWQDQEIIYDFRAQLQGTGSHSSDIFRYD